MRAGNATIVARFRREAEACSLLRNPHPVITFDFDETEDRVLYLAMELLHGRSLHPPQRAEGPLPPDTLLSINDKLTQAQAAATQQETRHNARNQTRCRRLGSAQ